MCCGFKSTRSLLLNWILSRAWSLPRRRLRIFPKALNEATAAPDLPAWPKRATAFFTFFTILLWARFWWCSSCETCSPCVSRVALSRNGVRACPASPASSRFRWSRPSLQW